MDAGMRSGENNGNCYLQHVAHVKTIKRLVSVAENPQWAILRKPQSRNESRSQPDFEVMPLRCSAKLPFSAPSVTDQKRGVQSWITHRRCGFGSANEFEALGCKGKPIVLAGFVCNSQTSQLMNCQLPNT
jgi:hypothetical protein